MATAQRNITINSTILFVVASVVEMTLHELGHFCAVIAVHAKHVSIHHNYTSNSNDGLGLTSNLLIKGAGPLVSLIIGVLFQLICARQAKRNYLFLFNLYMCLFGYIGFFGYLIIAPVFPGGDTGYICYSLGLPIWVTIIIAVLGAIALYVLINSLMKYFVQMASKQIMENKGAKSSFIRSLVLFPLLIGLVITTLLNLPLLGLISLIAPVCSPLTIMWGYGNAMQKNYSAENANKEFDDFTKLNIWLFTFVILAIGMNRFLANGVYIR